MARSVPLFRLEASHHDAGQAGGEAVVEREPLQGAAKIASRQAVDFARVKRVEQVTAKFLGIRTWRALPAPSAPKGDGF
jgi:hypothetical protein